MKTQKGVTLLSLILYMIALSIVIAMLGTISQLFFANTQYITENSKYVAEFNKFNMYFIEDVKKNKNTKEVTDNKVTFEDGTVYTYKSSPDNGIYRNEVKICNNIAYCKFTKQTIEVSGVTKHMIQLQMAIQGSHLFETTNEYVLRYW